MLVAVGRSVWSASLLVSFGIGSIVASPNGQGTHSWAIRGEQDSCETDLESQPVIGIVDSIV
jgi:hypothetical protein